MSKTKEAKPFEDMTPAEKRVAIAQDLIAHVAAGKIRPTRGTYLSAPPDYRGAEYAFRPDDKRQACEVLAAMRVCECCQIGGLLYATVLRANAVQVGQLVDEPGDAMCEDGFGGYLREFFDEDQLYLMESTFEGWCRTSETAVSEFFNRHRDRQKRMVAICQNIIDHDGEFVP